jgi:hypothetical protein
VIRDLSLVLALVFGLPVDLADQDRRDWFAPSGYPMLWDADECSEPDQLDEATWLRCMFKHNW